MSHFATVKTSIKDREALITALNELKIEFEESSTQLLKMNTRWSGNEKQLVDMVIRGASLGIGADVGFKFDATEKTYQIVADDWELRRSKYHNFRQTLTEEYTVAIAVKSGYRVVGRSRAADGRMQIELETTQQIQVRR